jgi:hypothetical protein
VVHFGGCWVLVCILSGPGLSTSGSEAPEVFSALQGGLSFFLIRAIFFCCSTSSHSQGTGLTLGISTDMEWPTVSNSLELWSLWPVSRRVLPISSMEPIALSLTSCVTLGRLVPSLGLCVLIYKTTGLETMKVLFQPWHAMIIKSLNDNNIYRNGITKAVFSAVWSREKYAKSFGKELVFFWHNIETQSLRGNKNQTTGLRY